MEILSSIIISYESKNRMDWIHADMVWYILLDLIGYICVFFLVLFIKIEKSIQKELEGKSDDTKETDLAQDL